MDRLHIAQLAHEVNRAYCASLGDTSQAAWADAPKWQQDSALAGVDMHTKNPDATPEQSHESWLEQKTAEGWAYGEVKDADKKLHPCFLPYAQLPVEQKAKDYLFRGVVHTALALPKESPVQAQVRQYTVDIPASATTGPATVSPIYAQTRDGILVRYIGKDAWLDRLYGSKLSFEPQQVRRVPGDLARRFLRHADMFESGVAVLEQAAAQYTTSAPEHAATTDTNTATETAVVDDTATVLEQAAKDKAQDDTVQSQLQDMLDTVNAMDKDALQSFAQEKFNQKVPKNLSVDNMRLRVGEFIQAYGV